MGCVPLTGMSVALVIALGCAAGNYASRSSLPRPRECDARRVDVIRTPQTVALTMIAHCPGSRWLPLMVSASPHPFKEDGVAEAWAEAARRHPDDPDVLANAADALVLGDPDQAESLFKEAIRLRPRSAPLWFALANLYELQGGDAMPDEPSEEAELALSAMIEGLRVATPDERFHELPEAALIALWAGAVVQAEAWARYGLSQRASVRGSWFEGNLIHHGHRVLGHIALLRDDVPLARRHLLASASGPTSPQLASFGPRMSLARALLDRGERASVLAYLEACRRIWHSPHRELEEWIAAIESGGTPADFGGDLFY